MPRRGTCGVSAYSSQGMHGTSIFAGNESGDIFHTYSTYHRGDELLMGAFI